jgi:hypothetical protein
LAALDFGRVRNPAQAIADRSNPKASVPVEEHPAGPNADFGDWAALSLSQHRMRRSVCFWNPHRSIRRLSKGVRLRGHGNLLCIDELALSAGTIDYPVLSDNPQGSRLVEIDLFRLLAREVPFLADVFPYPILELP